MTTRPAPFFTRLVATPYEQAKASICAALDGSTPTDAHDATRVHLTLTIGRLRRRVPMRLEISPWSSAGTTTWLELVPMRAVRPDPRYYRAGHRLLDELTGTAAAGLPRAHVPGQTERRSVDCAA